MTYGTFAQSAFGLFPPRERVQRDFAAMADVGVNTVRTYTVPGPEILDLAEASGLRLLIGIWWDDPRYLPQPTERAWRSMVHRARAAVHEAVTECANHPAVLGFLVGNEIPGPVVRWHGRRRVEGLLRRLYETGKAASPHALFGYANYPTTAYLDTKGFDFDAFNVFLEDEGAYRRYLAQLQIDVGDRPLVLTELGLDSASHGEARQAAVLDWQLRAATEHGAAGACVFSWTDEWWVGGHKVEGWRFGVTREDRTPKAARTVVGRHYRSGGLLQTRKHWPRVSVIVCAYQQETCIEQCVQSLVRLDYPDFEILVVDDGSTDATASLARRFPVRVISEGRLGLSGARNLGLERATGDLVAYIDADAWADPDWLTYLAIALEPADAACAGGPNLPPPDDPPVAQCVARAPGRPTHVLLDNERAEHVPGCNMAFRRHRLLEIGGFDPLYRAAGDDVDVCWRLQDRGYSIRFHPAAIVWHWPRSRVRDFWRQQVCYGRAESLLARNHPEKCDIVGHAIWHGVIYGPSSSVPGRSYIYGGRFGDAPYQRLLPRRASFDVLTALYGIAGLSVLAVLDLHLIWLPVTGLLLVLTLFLGYGIRLAHRERLRPAWRMGSLIGFLHLMQPVAREVGRLRARKLAFPSISELAHRFPALRPEGQRLFMAGGVKAEERSCFLEDLRERLRASRLPTIVAPPFEETDLITHSTGFWQARLTTYVQWDTLYLRLTRRLRRWPWLVVITLATLLAGWSPWVVLVMALGMVALVWLEAWWFGRRVRRVLSDLPAGSETGGVR